MRNGITTLTAGGFGLILTLALTRCTTGESPTASARETQPASALTSTATTPFRWHFTEEFLGSDKVAMARQYPFPGLRDIMRIVRRTGDRLEMMSYLEDEEIIDFPPSPPFGPAKCVGNPAMVNAGTEDPMFNDILILIKTAAGNLQLGKTDGMGGWNVLATFGSGLNDGRFGNPAMAFNPVRKTLEVMYREDQRIRHWSGTRNSNGTYSFTRNALIPGTGGTGTRVISALGLTAKADGRLVVVARRSEKNLRFWSTTNTAWPYAWQTGAAFGHAEESTEAPSIATLGDGTQHVLAMGRRSGTVSELLHYEIRNGVPAFLSAVSGPHHTGPIPSTGHSHPVVAALDASTLMSVTAFRAGSIVGIGMR